MTTEKTKLINTIADRIKTERENHPFIDWEIFAAQKIYDTLITYWQEKTRWIPVEERLPKAITINTNVSRQVWVKLEGRGYRVMQYDHLAKRFFPQYVNEVITHWKEIE